MYAPSEVRCFNPAWQLCGNKCGKRMLLNVMLASTAVALQQLIIVCAILMIVFAMLIIVWAMLIIVFERYVDD